MSWKVGKVNLGPLERRFSARRMQRAQMLLAERVGRDSNVHAPVDSGHLHDDTLHIEKDKVMWTADYAIYPYKGHVRGPSAGGNAAKREWFEYAKRIYFPSWVKTVEEALR